MEHHLLVSIIVYLSTGVLTGILSGLFGIGGGVVLVPVLSFIFSYNQLAPPGIIMQMAAATSLAVAMGTTFIAARTHNRYGYILWPLFRQLAPGLIIGAIIGVSVADLLQSQWLRVFFGIFLCGNAWYFIFPGNRVRHQQLPSQRFINLTSTVIGALGSMLGVSGAILTIPWLTYYGVPLRNTIAVSTACGFSITVVASIMYMILGLNESAELPPGSIGFVYWPAALGILTTTLIVAPIATRLAYRLPLVKLQRLFGLLLLILAARMLIY